MHKAHRVKLIPDERAYLEQRLAAGKAAARTLTHARILLTADEGAGEVVDRAGAVHASACGRRGPEAERRLQSRSRAILDLPCDLLSGRSLAIVSTSPTEFGESWLPRSRKMALAGETV